VWGDTHGLAQDAQGHIYVAHTVNKSSMRGEAVVVYDASGRFMRAFGEEVRGGAHGLGMRREKDTEILYHCDMNQCKITKTTLNSTTLTASPLIPPARIPSSCLRIVGTRACKPTVWTAHIFSPLKTIPGSVCRVTFIPKASARSVRTSTVRFAFSTATTTW